MRDVPLFPLRSDGLPPTPDTLLPWVRSLAQGQTEVVVDPLPERNANLPDILAACGLSQVTTSQRLAVNPAFWVGQAGARVAVNGASEGSPTVHGHLAGSVLTTSPHPHVDTARIEAAASLVGIIPDGHGEAMAWNPVARDRRCLVAFPAGDHHPWALRDAETGARHPLQVCEGILGPELLCSLPLAGLEARCFHSEDNPVTGAPPWEVSEEILDNGIVRAEIDLYGRINRLCFGGRFVALPSALLQAGAGDAALDMAPARLRVLEDGPVRARVQASIDTASGVLHLTYTLHAFDPCLRVTAAWDRAPAQAWLDLSTGNLVRPWLRSNGYVMEAGQPGLCASTWLRFDDGRDGGLALAAAQAIQVEVTGPSARIAMRPGLSFAISDPALADPATMAEEWLLRGIGTAGRKAPGLPGRLVGGAGVARAWAQRLGDGSGEIVLVEQYGRSARLWLHAPRGRAWLCNLRGQAPRLLARTGEDDAWQIDLEAGAIVCLRWL